MNLLFNLKTKLACLRASLRLRAIAVQIRNRKVTKLTDKVAELEKWIDYLEHKDLVQVKQLRRVAELDQQVLTLQDDLARLVQQRRAGYEGANFEITEVQEQVSRSVKVPEGAPSFAELQRRSLSTRLDSNLNVVNGVTMEEL